jgi:hypothetical protein
MGGRDKPGHDDCFEMRFISRKEKGRPVGAPFSVSDVTFYQEPKTEVDSVPV